MAAKKACEVFSKSLLEEVKRWGRRQQRGVSLREMMEFGSKPTPENLLISAQFLHEELAVRIARRAIELEKLPYGLSQKPAVLKVYPLFFLFFFYIIAILNLQSWVLVILVFVFLFPSFGVLDLIPPLAFWVFWFFMIIWSYLFMWERSLFWCDLQVAIIVYLFILVFFLCVLQLISWLTFQRQNFFNKEIWFVVSIMDII